MITGGTINGTSNDASVIFDGGSALIHPAGAGTITSGSQFVFQDGVIAAVLGGTLIFTNVGTMDLIGPSSTYLSNLAIQAGINASPLTLSSGTPRLYLTNTTAHSIYNQGGYVFIEGGTTVKLTKAIPAFPGSGYYQTAGSLNIQNGSKLEVVSPNWITIDKGNLNTYSIGTVTNPAAGSNTATIKADKVSLGGVSGKTVRIKIDNSILRPDLVGTPHRYGVLQVFGNVNWQSGIYSPVVNPDDPGSRDRWLASGSFTVNANATQGNANGFVQISPVGTPSTGSIYSVMEVHPRTGQFVSATNNNVMPYISGANGTDQPLWGWKTGSNYTATFWQIKRINS